MSWTLAITQPWELGAAGSQTVTVLKLNDADGSITLRREGYSVGPFAAEKPTVTLSRGGRSIEFNVSPGRAHWRGVTTFRKGIVVSDELLVDRNDELRSPQTDVVHAVRRRFILLNSSP
ncbi:MAG: hypothetical protein ABIS14_04910, partial [Sphingomonas sp.]